VRLEVLIDEVLDLVRAHMPDVDLSRFSCLDTLGVRDCHEKPVLRPRE